MRIIKLALIIAGIIILIISINSVTKEAQNEKIISPVPENTVTPTREPNVEATVSAQPKPTHNLQTVSWYGNEFCRQFNPSCRTASGEIFDDSKFTCACDNSYPLGTTLRFTYQDKSVVARCNDRGNFKGYGRTADLSKASFESLAPLSKGILQVKVEAI